MTRTKTRFWQIRAAAPRIGELLLYGPLGDTAWLGDEVSPAQFNRDLAALGELDELRIYINSPGGDVFAGQAIYNMLVRYPARKVVYVDGLAASAASLVAMAGDRIVMPRNALMMVHEPWTIVAGFADDLLKAAAELEKVRDSLVAVYQSRTRLPRERVEELLAAETWMSAEEAVELGFADEIEEAKQVAASLCGSTLLVNGLEVDLARFRSRPKVVFGVVPEDVSDELAPEDAPWEAPSLRDFTDKRWEDLSDAERRRIAGHFAWAATMPPERFEDLKLPHHRPSDGAVVWRGVVAAAQRLDQTDIPTQDKEQVRRHLERHYEQFGRTPPWKAEARLRLLQLELELEGLNR